MTISLSFRVMSIKMTSFSLLAVPFVGTGIYYFLLHFRRKNTETNISTMHKFAPHFNPCKSCKFELQQACYCPDECKLFNIREVFAVLKKASNSIDICIALLTHPDVCKDLIHLHSSGIKIRCIFDKHLTRQAATAQRIIDSIIDAGIEVALFDMSSSHIMHHKFIIVDKGTLLNGSLNWTYGGFNNNFENIEITNDKQAVNAFKNEFEYLWLTSNK